MGTVFLYSATNPLPLYLLGNIALIIFLLLAGAFFSSTETAFTALSKIRARQMVKDGKKNSVLVTKLRNNLDFLIATVLVGTNFVNTLNSAVVTAFAIKIFGPESVTIMTSVILVLVIIFVEIVPKTYAVYYPERICSNSARKIWLIEIAIWPLIKIFCFFTSFIDVVEQKLIKSNRQLVTEEELKTLIEVGEKEGTLEVSERKMLDRLFEFSDITVHTIMRHRSLVKYISVDDSLDSVLALFQSTGYSKIPVYENDIENIIGVLNYRSVLFADRMVTASRDFIKICMQEVMFVPETMSAIELLKKFRMNKTNFAVAVNEYGSMAGLVTMDDILHEVFGRITDEHGMVETAPENRITVVNVNEFVVPGDMKLDDLKDVLNIQLVSENFETLGGWLLEQMGELPVVGSVFKKGNVVYIVEDQSSRRIQTVRIKL